MLEGLGSLFVGIAAVVTSLASAWQTRKALREEIAQQNAFIDSSIRKLNGIASAIVQSFDGPCWIKLAVPRPDGTVEFRMQEINAAYEQSYGINRLDYIGKTDIEAGWSKEQAEDFRRNDLDVWSTGQAHTYTEMILGKPTLIRKIRVQSAEGALKGVMGYVATSQ